MRKNPIKNGHDSNGDYYQWGNQKKYYYDSSSVESRTSAYSKARKQASAIFASGYQPKRNPRIPLDGMEDRRNATKRSISDMSDGGFNMQPIGKPTLNNAIRIAVENGVEFREWLVHISAGKAVAHDSDYANMIVFSWNDTGITVSVASAPAGSISNATTIHQFSDIITDEQAIQAMKQTGLPLVYADISPSPTLRRNSALHTNNFQEVKGVVTGFNAKITFVDDGEGNEIELDIDDIEAVSMTPIDEMEMDASCHFTFRPMVSSDGEFHGNYLKTFDWWYE